jgi:tetratricopeptide (TPR) repeat protein
MTQPASTSRLLQNALRQASRGQHRAALTSLDAALSLNPREAVLHHNRGLLLRQLNRPGPASQALLQAHRLQPGWLEPLLALSELALDQPQATTILPEQLEQVLAQPAWQSDARALLLRGRWAERRRAPQEAEALYRAALEQHPSLALAKQQLTCLLLSQERWPEAEQLLQQLLEQDPERADLLSNLAIALLRQNRLPEALAAAKAALAVVSGDDARASVLVNLGSIEQELGQRQPARQHYRQALELDPCQANALLNLGVLDLQARDLEGAEWHYRQALLLNPGDARVAVNLAGSLLLQGRAEEGWQHYEARLGGSSQLLHQPQGLPLWQGSSLKGDLLLVHEQGLGDSFQFIRYAELLREELGLRCHFQGPTKLHPLLQRSGLVESCCAEADPAPDSVTAWVPLMSLPGLLQASPAQPRATANPYLSVDLQRLEHWQKLLGPPNKLRIALHWQGNPDHEFTISRGRSFPLSTLAALTALQDVEWISLQKGPGSEQASQGPYAILWHPQQPAIDLAWSFDDAAAILASCDGLVSSDSGLAHLAGAIGCRVWLLLPWLAEWRWGLSGDSTAWYPQHTLLRQGEEGDWSEPVDRLRTKLETLRRA